jgi:8-oxo-dGTP pyrophosphatase MutT (NUDIX family)
MSYCSHCGSGFPEGSSWPGGKTCAACGKRTWLNPIPAVNLLVPIKGGGIIVLRRGINPQKGKWATPGGFIERHETWQLAAVRELLEEHGIIAPSNLKPAETAVAVESLARNILDIQPTDLRLYAALNNPPNPLALFALMPRAIDSRSLPFYPNLEASERSVVGGLPDLAFGIQTRVVRHFLTFFWTGDEVQFANNLCVLPDLERPSS